MLKRIFPLLLAISLLFSTSPALADEPTPTPTPEASPTPVAGPVYIIQPGDNLSIIASQFGVTLNDLMAANNITDANTITAGARITIPGLEGISGTLDTQVVQYGDSLASLSRRNQISEAFLRKLNHITSPAELYAGAHLVLPQKENFTPLTNRTSLTDGGTLLESAILAQSDPWTLAVTNSLAGTWSALPGDVLYATTDSTASTANGLPSAFLSAQVKTLPIKQGGTAEIIIKPASGVKLGGFLIDQSLHFFDMGDGNQVALQGVSAQLTPGAYPLRLDATLPDGSTQSFEQMVLVKFGIDNPALQSVPSMDPSILDSENQQIASIASTVTPAKAWQGEFSLPVALPYCIKEWFGTPRSYTYNNSNFNYFHSGVDYGVCSAEHPLDIYAAAPGKVVFVGLLAIRGNTTIVDDGWGVYTLYGHQSRIDVTVGQEVQAGENIGQIGETGHVTGPHLHWEMWVNGVQVNPLDWLETAFP
jgi:murein DD-endopeptidase MepM/ murein hydrolase activator NlpD